MYSGGSGDKASMILKGHERSLAGRIVWIDWIFVRGHGYTFTIFILDASSVLAMNRDRENVFEKIEVGKPTTY